MDLILPQAQEYAERYSSEEDSLLNAINADTVATHEHHHMLSGHLQGKMLEMISWMVRPRRILEIGTFTGYSAISLAKGLTPDGLLHTIELREEDALKAKSYFDRSDFNGKIIQHTGDALAIIPTLTDNWDLVFIDADKANYINYFNLVLPYVRKNRFILADNIFFHGQVLEDEVTGKSARAIQEFNDHIRQRSDIDKMIITLRDGLYLLRKL